MYLYGQWVFQKRSQHRQKDKRHMKININGFVFWRAEIIRIQKNLHSINFKIWQKIIWTINGLEKWFKSLTQFIATIFCIASINKNRKKLEDLFLKKKCMKKVYGILSINSNEFILFFVHNLMMTVPIVDDKWVSLKCQLNTYIS